MLAEVMDKEPRITVIWAIFLGLALAGVALARVRWWLGLVVAGVVGVLGWLGVLGELADPYVGPAIWKESPLYAPQAYLAVALGILVSVGAALKSRIHRAA